MPHHRRTLGRAVLGPIVGLLLASSPAALADDVAPSAPPPADETWTEEEEAAPEAVVLKFVPSRFAYDGGVQLSYGFNPQFLGSPAWVGFGGRFAWGRTWTDHRLGFGAAISFEGPLGIQWTNVLELGVQWDYVHPKGLYLGASLGPALMLNADLKASSGYDLSFDAAPFVAFRIGWSQRFSLVARRFYIAVEPRLRIVDGQPAFLAALVFGSGRGI